MGDEEDQLALVHEGVWPSPVPLICCIYRVPNRLRRVNPDAYTPQVLLIGPLHHSKKHEAKKLAEQYFPSEANENIKSRYMGYLKMEHQKKVYKNALEERVGKDTVAQLRSTIEMKEEEIRQSYAESTSTINSPDFVHMIFFDSIFILECTLRLTQERDKTHNDLLLKTLSLESTVKDYLILLENQLPYFILDRLIEPIVETLVWVTDGDSFKLATENTSTTEITSRNLVKKLGMTFRQLILIFFGLGERTEQGEFKSKIRGNTEFEHFTDLLRRVRVETLDLTRQENKNKESVRHLYSATKLRSAGVEFKPQTQEHWWEVKPEGPEDKEPCFKCDLTIPCFKADDEEKFNQKERKHLLVEAKLGAEPEHSLVVNFKKKFFRVKGDLTIPSFKAIGEVELRLRNIMALEQCHYPSQAYVCSYLLFLDFLIDTDEDVGLLIEKGIIKNRMGHHGSVAEMVKKLCLGVVEESSVYSDISKQLNDHYKNPINRSCATLRRVYFENFWKGTATVIGAIVVFVSLFP